MNHLYLRQPAATGREPGSTIPRGIYQSTSLPVYQSTSLPVYQSISLSNSIADVTLRREQYFTPTSG